MVGSGFFIALLIAASIGAVITATTMYVVSIIKDIRKKTK